MSVLVLTGVRVYCTLCLAKVLSGSLAWRSWFRTLYEMGIVSWCEDDNMMFQIEIFA